MQQKLEIKFYLNDKFVQVAVAPATTALQLLREQLALIGAKEVCVEGDCGACTVALGKWCGEEFKYMAVNSCLLPAARLHGCHLITVEGLAEANKLHLIQAKMLEHHAVQCGYCTTGMIMALFCLFANNFQPDRQDILAALEGNICRCTGYQAIYDAAQNVAEKQLQTKDIFPSYVIQVQKQLKKFAEKIVAISELSKVFDKLLGYHIVQNLDELWKTLSSWQSSEYKIINGGTDLMVLANVQKKMPQHFIDISNIAELKFVRQEKNEIVIGGAMTLTELLHSVLIETKLPTLHFAITKMASNQIRNIATIAGNIANASPIADSACVSLALGAKLQLKTEQGERVVALENFYLEHKVTQLQNGEIIYAIKIPCEQGLCHFEKSAKRASLDIAAVSSTINVISDKSGVITAACIAFGGVAKYPALARATCAYLIGKKIDAETFAAAAQIAQDEFTPISDIRGSAAFRRQLIHNHIIKHFVKFND